MKRRTIGLIVGVVIAVLGIAVSSLNPLLSIGVSNQLEGACTENRFDSWTYHRSSWTPLRWSCTVVERGRRREIRPAL
jgi:hypothetical protein